MNQYLSLLLCVAFSVCGDVALAQETSERVARVFVGSVHAPSGTPVAGAVVVSSAGGKAVTDELGEYRLEVSVAQEAKSVHVTAVGGASGKLTASKSVSLLGGAGPVTVVPIQLVQVSACTPEWLPTFGADPGTSGTVNALVVFDDGSGAALYAGGAFTIVGGQEASAIAKWDGRDWSPLGVGVNGGVQALAVYDDGGGADLYVGGFFNFAGGLAASQIARWDGSTWSAMGSGMSSAVNALEVFDDGSGVALYAGGGFATAGGVTVNGVAKWDGSSWSALGSGMVNGFVNAFAAYDDGGGYALYAAGTIPVAGIVTVNNIAKWNGSSWSALGLGTSGRVDALTVFDDGTGDALIVGGGFTSAGGAPANHIAKWNGSSWSALGAGVRFIVFELTVFDDGTGPTIYAGGRYITAGGVVPVNNIEKWDGVNWTVLSGELGYGPGYGGSAPPLVLAFAAFDDGGGLALHVGGNFWFADTAAARNVVKLESLGWSGLGRGLNDEVTAFEVFDDGAGSALFAGGGFLSAGGAVANRIAKWDGSNWSTLGTGVAMANGRAQVNAMKVFDDGGGLALFVGGSFTSAGGVTVNNIAKWDGSGWSSVGSGMTGTSVDALEVFDDGGGAKLYACWNFTTVGGAPASSIASWDGSTWTVIGSGMNAYTYCLSTFDDSGGLALYAGGEFTMAGGVPASRIAKWDGLAWTALGAGVNQIVRTLAVFDDGGGSSLCAGGGFSSAGGGPSRGVAAWDGSSWSGLDLGVMGVVFDLAVADDGTGPALFAGGNFGTAAGVQLNQMAKWDGTSWSALGGGMNWNVAALKPFDDGGGLALYAGGYFTVAFDSRDSFIAKWGCPDSPFVDLCNGDGGNQVGCTNCPCSNDATAGTIGGCLNSTLSSSRLCASGDPAVNLSPGSVDDLRFSLMGAPANAFCVLNSGDALSPSSPANPCFGTGNGSQVPFLDGLRCAVTNTRLHGGRAADSNGEVGATNEPWGGEGGPAAGIASAGGGFVAGQTRFFQVIHRDDPLMVCMRGLNTSQAVSVLFTPGL